MIQAHLIASILTVSQPDVSRSPSVLFVRGAPRSGGFFEADTDAQRTEHLADIHNTSTIPGNHGWSELAELLRSHGYSVSQITEPLEPQAPMHGPTSGAPIPFEIMDLSVYDVIVMGSNNAVYSPASIDAFEQYIRSGGSALFIADAGFGSHWADASSSDQQFLDRFGWVIQQDLGVYDLRREDNDFIEPDHPVLLGVDAIEGEGVSPGVWLGADVPGVHTSPLVRAQPGAMTRNNDGVPGSVRPVALTDASLIVAHAECGRIALHFDRNTFFNTNGAGTDLNQLDHRVYAQNLFAWLARGGADLNLDRVTDFDDLLLFLVAFVNEDPGSDLTAPFGVFDITDILAYLELFERCR